MKNISFINICIICILLTLAILGIIFLQPDYSKIVTDVAKISNIESKTSQPLNLPEYLISNRPLFISKESVVLKEEIISKVSSQEWFINKSAALRYIGNLNQLMGEVKISPSVVSGKVVGIKISGLKDGGLIKKAGFREGDIIMSINGRGISNLRDVAKRLFNISRNNESEIKVELQRDNHKEMLNFTII